MRILSTFLILFLFVSVSFGQIKFEKGYIITNDHKRVECFIKNLDWKNNPADFIYKLTELSTPEMGNLASVREFGISKSFRFVNAEVKIDRQTKPAVNPKNEAIPVWTKEKLFLRVISEGKAKLYSYESTRLKRFFYSLNDTSITQLIYLEALNGTTLVKNTSYQQQLWGNLRAPMATMNSIKEIGYNEKDLTAYIEEYNGDSGTSTSPLVQTKRRAYFNLKFAPGLNISSVSLSTVLDGSNKVFQSTFDSKPTFRLGLESELILPFNNYHWGILFEPTFQSYQSDVEGKYGTSTITYSSIEFPIGLRYYYPLNDNTRLFLNGLIIPAASMNLNSKIEYHTFFANMTDVKTVDVASSGSAALGGGVEHKRFSLETRYYTSRNLFSGQPSESANYSRFSVVLGYKFVKTRLK